MSMRCGARRSPSSAIRSTSPGVACDNRLKDGRSCRQPAPIGNGRARIPAVSPQQDATSAARGIRRALAGQRDPREGAQLPAEERLAVALLSLIRQPTRHDAASRSNGECKQVGRKALGAIGGDRPRRQAGNAVGHATVGGSGIRQLRARRCSPSRVSGGGSPNAPRRSARSPCRSNRRSTRARRPRPPGTRPG